MGMNYYRLKHTDQNDVSQYFNITSVNMLQRESKVGTLTAGSSSFTDDINVSYISPANGLVELTLYDMTGRVEKSIFAQVKSGKNILSINETSELPAGTYLVEISIGNTKTPLIEVIKNN
jgi:hypothetical protein